MEQFYCIVKNEFSGHVQIAKMTQPDIEHSLNHGYLVFKFDLEARDSFIALARSFCIDETAISATT